MLVLSRKKNQSIILFTSDGEVKITLVNANKGDTVKIGFEAPLNVRILREEIANGYRDSKVDELP